MRISRAAVGSAVFFVVAPCVVAGAVPYLLTGWAGATPPWPWPVRAVGGLLLVGSVALLVVCFVRFVREGRGTPAPVAPTERLVVGGPYRYVRNPMYVGVVGAIVGQALLLGRPVLLAYALLVWLVVAGFVLAYEEPTMRETYGAEYERYHAAVRAWLPRLTPWRPS